MIIGIDPGYTGAIAFLIDSPQSLVIFDMPLQMINGRQQIDARTLTEMIRDESKYVPCVIAAVEDVASRPNQSASATFRFGYGAGVLYGVLCALGITVLRTPPAVWKSSLGLSSNKKDSLTLAKKTFPKFKSYFLRAKDDGRAEAALIAHRTWRFLK